MIEFEKGWKWLTAEDFDYFLPEEFVDYTFVGEYLVMKNGFLHIVKGYGWDGASGPAIDTENFMLASLVHDAIYEVIGKQGWFELRKAADKELVKIAKAEGMSYVRRAYVYRAVRMFGGKYAKKRFDGLEK